MNSIWKYRLKVTDRQEVMMPEGAIPLSCQVQRNEVCVWALCDSEKPMKAEAFMIYGTGYPLQERIPGLYLGTFQLEGGSLVFHVFLEQHGH